MIRQLLKAAQVLHYRDACRQEDRMRGAGGVAHVVYVRAIYAYERRARHNEGMAGVRVEKRT